MKLWASGSLIALVLVWGGGQPAFADAGEWNIGGMLELRTKGNLSLLGTTRLGLSDIVAAEISTGPGVFDGEAIWQNELSLVLALDVFEWVPELHFGAGGRFSRAAGWEPEASFGMRLRHYLGFHWSLWADVCALMLLDDRSVQGAVSAGFSYHFEQ